MTKSQNIFHVKITIIALVSFVRFKRKLRGIICKIISVRIMGMIVIVCFHMRHYSSFIKRVKVQQTMKILIWCSSFVLTFFAFSRESLTQEMILFSHISKYFAPDLNNVSKTVWYCFLLVKNLYAQLFVCIIFFNLCNSFKSH